MDFFEGRGPSFRLFIFFFPAFFFRFLLERCLLSEYRLVPSESERVLTFRLGRVVICFLGVFFERCAERDLEVRGLVDILFILDV